MTYCKKQFNLIIYNDISEEFLCSRDEKQLEPFYNFLLFLFTSKIAVSF